MQLTRFGHYMPRSVAYPTLHGPMVLVKTRPRLSQTQTLTLTLNKTVILTVTPVLTTPTLNLSPNHKITLIFVTSYLDLHGRAGPVFILDTLLCEMKIINRPNYAYTICLIPTGQKSQVFSIGFTYA